MDLESNRDILLDAYDEAIASDEMEKKPYPNRDGLKHELDSNGHRIGPQGCVFASDFPHEIAMEDALHEINEILERKDINDKHKAMILGENAKRFYNL